MLIVIAVFVTFNCSPVNKLYHIPVLGKLGVAVIVAVALKFPNTIMFRSELDNAMRRPAFQSFIPIFKLNVPVVNAAGYVLRSVIILAQASDAAFL